MSVKSELLNIINLVAESRDIPAVKQVYFPEPRPQQGKNTEFGIIILEDDAAGLYYAWLGTGQTRMAQRFPAPRNYWLFPAADCRAV